MSQSREFCSVQWKGRLQVLQSFSLCGVGRSGLGLRSGMDYQRFYAFAPQGDVVQMQIALPRDCPLMRYDRMNGAPGISVWDVASLAS